RPDLTGRPCVDAGVVHQDVERSLHSSSASSDRLRKRDVQLLDASSRDCRSLARIAHGDDDIVIPGEIARDGEPDPAVGSGDEGGRHERIDAGAMAPLLSRTPAYVSLTTSRSASGSIIPWKKPLPPEGRRLNERTPWKPVLDPGIDLRGLPLTPEEGF